MTGMGALCHANNPTGFLLEKWFVANSGEPPSKPVVAEGEAQTSSRTGTQRVPSRIGKAAITLYVDPAASKQLRLLSVEEDTSIQALMVEALNDLFTKRGLSPIA